MLHDRICKPITPTSVEVFYEDGRPYIKYTGTTVTDYGLTIQVEIPKMDLVLKEVTCECEDYYSGKARIVSSQNIYVKHDQWCKITPLRRTCSKEDLEKELGYKLDIVS